MSTEAQPHQHPAESDSKMCAFEQTAIYLLDDDLSILKALDRLLKAHGFKAEKFNHASEFLAAVGQLPCRLAILDVWMPDLNGLEVQALLGKSSPKTRIIFISGRDDPSVRQTALDTGAFGFLSKPFDDQELVGLVRDALAV
jgi:FixJ family two-component response regulator